MAKILCQNLVIQKKASNCVILTQNTPFFITSFSTYYISTYQRQISTLIRQIVSTQISMLFQCHITTFFRHAKVIKNTKQFNSISSIFISCFHTKSMQFIWFLLPPCTSSVFEVIAWPCSPLPPFPDCSSKSHLQQNSRNIKA
jgi:hypothetical protein